MDLELVGYVMQPEEIGCSKDSPSSSLDEDEACTNHTVENPLPQTTLMVGCHKTRYKDRAYRRCIQKNDTME